MSQADHPNAIIAGFAANLHTLCSNDTLTPFSLLLGNSQATEALGAHHGRSAK
jgi:hypothetical protein